MAVSQVRHQDSIYSYHIYPSDSSNMKNQSLLMHPYDFLPTITSGSLWNVSRVVTHNLLVYLVFLVLWYGFCPVASHSISTAQTKTSCETHSILLLCGLSQSASVKGADFFLTVLAPYPAGLCKADFQTTSCQLLRTLWWASTHVLVNPNFLTHHHVHRKQKGFSIESLGVCRTTKTNEVRNLRCFNIKAKLLTNLQL